jgi:hypothetical protein
MPKYLVRVEGVNLRNFIEDTQDLNTIRGGGLILLDAIERLQRKLPLLEKISTGASSGLFEIECEGTQIKEICNQIDVQLKNDHQCKHATIVFDLIEKTEKFLDDKERLLALNRWKQVRSPTLAIPDPREVNEGICSIDHVRPATTPHQNKKPISTSVKVRREYGQLQKQRFYKNLIQEELVDRLVFTFDFDQLTSLPDNNQQRILNHKMAVIYLDGNDFGKIQRQHCTEKETHQQFDQQIQSYRREFLRDLVLEMSKEADRDKWRTTDDKMRIETLLWGGDEMIWAVPAWNGWRTLRLFYQMSNDWQFQGVPLRHAAGIVFCHHNAPIHRIKQLAYNLANLAKKRSRVENLFAYEVLESFDHVSGDLERYRLGRSPGGREAEALILDGTQMATVEELAPGLLEKLSRRQLHRLVRQIIASEAPENDELKKILGNLTAELTMEEHSRLEEVRAALGGGDVSWLHLLTLWDYLA